MKIRQFVSDLCTPTDVFTQQACERNRRHQMALALRSGTLLNSRRMISGGRTENRLDLLTLSLRQAAAQRLPAAVLCAPGYAPPDGAGLYISCYDPAPGHSDRELAQTVCEAAGALVNETEGLEEPLLALLSCRSGPWLRTVAQVPLVEQEARCFAGGWELPTDYPRRHLSSLLLRIGAALPEGGTPLSLCAALEQAPAACLTAENDAVWFLALAEALRLPGVLLVLNGLPYELPPRLARALSTHSCLLLSDADLPACPLWDTARKDCSGAVFFSHSDGASAQKIAQYVGEHEVRKAENSNSTGRDTMRVFGHTETRGTTFRAVREARIAPEQIQSLAPDTAVIKLPQLGCTIARMLPRPDG